MDIKCIIETNHERLYKFRLVLQAFLQKSWKVLRCSEGRENFRHNLMERCVKTLEY